MANDNPPPQSDDPLAALAKRLEHDPQFMASVLRQYQIQRKITKEAVIEELETTRQMIIRLALCKRPDEQSPQFAQQIQELSAYAHIEAVRLERLLQQVSDPRH